MRGSTRRSQATSRPRAHPDEPLEDLIDDPWRRVDCEPDPTGCVAELEDPEFATGGRDAIYYARAVEEASPGIGVSSPACAASSDDCLQPVEQRAWSSPLFVDFQATGPARPSSPPSNDPSTQQRS